MLDEEGVDEHADPLSAPSSPAIPDLFQASIDIDLVEQRHGAFGGYTRRDKYGFELPEEFLELELRAAQKLAEHERAQQEAWREYIERREAEQQPLVGTSRFRQLTRRGVPAEYRRRVWVDLLLQLSDGNSAASRESPRLLRDGAEELSTMHPDPVKSIASARKTYQAILREVEHSETAFRSQIEADVRRTFPDHAEYDSDDGLRRLANVLMAFSYGRSDIGYCQSMNFICAQLLLILDEESAFWAFNVIVKALIPHTYFTRDMIGSHIDQRVFEELIKEKLPVLYKKVSKYSLRIGSVTAQWFLCLLVCVTPAETTFRVWDWMLLEGMNVLFKVALAMLKESEKELLECEDEGIAFAILRDVPRKAYDAEKLLKLAQTSFSKVTEGKIQRLRDQYGEVVRDEQQELLDRREKAAQRRRERKEREAQEASAVVDHETRLRMRSLCPEQISVLKEAQQPQQSSTANVEVVWERRETTPHKARGSPPESPARGGVKIGARME